MTTVMISLLTNLACLLNDLVRMLQVEALEAVLQQTRRDGRAKEARHRLTVERLRRQIVELQVLKPCPEILLLLLSMCRHANAIVYMSMSTMPGPLQCELQDVVDQASAHCTQDGPSTSRAWRSSRPPSAVAYTAGLYMSTANTRRPCWHAPPTGQLCMSNDIDQCKITASSCVLGPMRGIVLACHMRRLAAAVLMSHQPFNVLISHRC